MKKIAKATIALLMVSLLVIPCLASAAELPQSDVDYIGNGYYVKHEIVVQSKARTVKTFYKTSTVYDTDDNAQCVLQFNATFDYGNGYVKCTNAWAQQEIYNDSWSIVDINCTYSTASVTKASANATFTFKKKFLGIVIKTKHDSLSITCDKNGVPG